MSTVTKGSNKTRQEQYKAYLVTRARIVELIDKLNGINLPNPDETEEADLFETLSKPLIEKENALDELLKNEAYRKLRSIHVVKKISLSHPSMRRVYQIPSSVDFGSMSSQEVFDYDGYYGGEERIRAKKRIAAEDAKKNDLIACGWPTD